MIDAPLELAFGAGMAAAFNPCGFALLPAYVSFFLGTGADAGNEADGHPGGLRSRARAGGRALAVGGAVTTGFVAVFGLAGILVTQASLTVSRWTPWISVVIGIALVVLGVALLRGYELKVSLPRLSKGGSSRGLASMTAFGASYATVSLSCTLPIFLAAVSTTFQAANFISGVLTFVAYALGMGTVLMVLTLAVAMSRDSLVSRLRRVQGWIMRASGILLVVAGAYVAYYGYYDIQINRNADVSEGPVAWVTRWSGDVSTWISDVGAVRLALVGGLVVASLVAVATLVGRRRGPVDTGPGAGERAR